MGRTGGPFTVGITEDNQATDDSAKVEDGDQEGGHYGR